MKKLLFLLAASLFVNTSFASAQTEQAEITGCVASNNLINNGTLVDPNNGVLPLQIADFTLSDADLGTVESGDVLDFYFEVQLISGLSIDPTCATGVVTYQVTVDSTNSYVVFFDQDQVFTADLGFLQSSPTYTVFLQGQVLNYEHGITRFEEQLDVTITPIDVDLTIFPPVNGITTFDLN